MDQDDQNRNDSNEEGNFADLLDQTLSMPARFEPGQMIETTIVKISGEWAFLDLGGKTEGFLAREELLDEEGNLTVSEGETVTAYFLFSKDQEKIFTTKVGRGAAGRKYLESAFKNGIPVEGYVEKEIKGGFEVRIAGEISGFCPYSQMGLRRIHDSAEVVGQHLSFKITDYQERPRNVILSNRAILEEERKKLKDMLRNSLQEGMVVKGTISSIQKFGAFVDIGGLEGLIPISEIGWGRVEDIHDVLKVGQEVEVSTMKLDWEKDRFSFSLKETLPDPWDTIKEKYPEGSCHTRQVGRLARFGAFVTMEPGVDGLLPISNLDLGRRINHPREVLTEGQSVEVRIDSLDKERKRISLSLAVVNQEVERKAEENQFQKYLKKEKRGSEGSLGTLGDLLKTKLKK